MLFDITPLCENAVIITMASKDVKVQFELMRIIEEKTFCGFQECVPLGDSLCVYYDPYITYRWLQYNGNQDGKTYNWVCEWIKQHIDEALMSKDINELQQTYNTIKIPVCYCSRCGYDQAEVARSLHLHVDDIAHIHSSSAYKVAMIGFMPGFPYLDGLPERLWTTRLNSPRQQVAAGSIGIAGNRCGIYPQATPGGWRIIGRTAATLFDEGRSQPSLLHAGDTVIFIRVEHDQQLSG
jgi:KipI family sensor histidine kinase inhibitor